MKAETKVVTPAMAEKWLAEHNKNNYRSLRKLTVERYARDMAVGRWEENGEPVIFNGRGDLLDGQHRLAAVVESQAAVKMLIVRDVQAGMLTIDRGVPRQFRDELRRRGFKRVDRLAGLVRMLFHYRQGKGDPRRSSPTPSSHDLAELFETDTDGMDHSAATAQKDGCQGLLANASGAICHYLFTQAGGQDYADRFFRDFGGLVGLRKKDPALVLRKRLEADHARGAQTSGAVGSTSRQALTILAWNKWIRDEDVVLLKWMPVVMKFPIPLGAEV